MAFAIHMRAEYPWPRSYVPQRLNYLLSDPLQKKLLDLCCKESWYIPEYTVMNKHGSYFAVTQILVEENKNHSVTKWLCNRDILPQQSLDFKIKEHLFILVNKWLKSHNTLARISFFNLYNCLSLNIPRFPEPPQSRASILDTIKVCRKKIGVTDQCLIPLWQMECYDVTAEMQLSGLENRCVWGTFLHKTRCLLLY